MPRPTAGSSGDLLPPLPEGTKFISHVLSNGYCPFEYTRFYELNTTTLIQSSSNFDSYFRRLPIFSSSPNIFFNVDKDYSQQQPVVKRNGNFFVNDYEKSLGKFFVSNKNSLGNIFLPTDDKSLLKQYYSNVFLAPAHLIPCHDAQSPTIVYKKLIPVEDFSASNNLLIHRPSSSAVDSSAEDEFFRSVESLSAAIRSDVSERLRETLLKLKRRLYKVTEEWMLQLVKGAEFSSKRSSSLQYLHNLDEFSTNLLRRSASEKCLSPENRFVFRSKSTDVDLSIDDVCMLDERSVCICICANRCGIIIQYIYCRFFVAFFVNPVLVVA